MKKQTLKLSIGNHTDVGKVRDINQDRFGSASADWGNLLVVADGMGGHLGGEMAAQMTVDSLTDGFQTSPVDDPAVFLDLAIKKADKKVSKKGADDTELTGMGTTVVAAIIRDGRAYLAHVGDSRIYLFRNNKWKQITNDHSVVQKMVDEGLLTEAEAESHPEKNRILQAIGLGGVEPEHNSLPLYKNDILLLCSDGLSGLVDGRGMISVVSKESPMSAAKQLTSLANDRGGHDNITVIIAKVDKGPKAPKEPKAKPKEKSPPKKGVIKNAIYLFAGVILGIVVFLILQDVGILGKSSEDEKSPTDSADEIKEKVPAEDTKVEEKESVEELEAAEVEEPLDEKAEEIDDSNNLSKEAKKEKPDKEDPKKDEGKEPEK
tara:strand:+ start:2147 stop:3277 length:1131 start_codon:yes stop_codon:yes gene_type:complete